MLDLYYLKLFFIRLTCRVSFAYLPCRAHTLPTELPSLLALSFSPCHICSPHLCCYHSYLLLLEKYTSGPRYWNVPVLVNTGTFFEYQYYLKMWYLWSLERTGVIQKLTILERKNGLVLSNTHVPVSGTKYTFPLLSLLCLFLYFLLFSHPSFSFAIPSYSLNLSL